jgi:hypothetical protein
MVNFYARDFIGAVESLERLKQRTTEGFQAGQFQLIEITDVGADLRILESHLRGLDLPISCAQIERIATALDGHGKPVNALEFVYMLKDLRQRIDDELRLRVFYGVSAEHVRQFFRPVVKTGRMESKGVREIYGADVAEAFFKNDDHDASEAMSCLIHDRATAAVFHLMRMLEMGLTPFASLFGVSMAHTNWGPALEEIASKIKKRFFSEKCDGHVSD